jgi:hypothetical protein
MMTNRTKVSDQGRIWSIRPPVGSNCPHEIWMNCGRALCAGIAVSVLASGALAQQTPLPPPLQNLPPEQAEAVRALLQQSDALRAQALQKLTPAQLEMINPMLQQTPTAPGGAIRGFVEAALPGKPGVREVALPGAKVYIQSAGGEVDQTTVTSTERGGHFYIVSRPPGSYDVCAALQGFTTGCYNVAVVNHNVNMQKPISLKPIGAAIRGCVTSKNGAPAARSAVSPYETAGVAEVSAVNAAGQILAGPVPVNTVGCYVLPGIPATADWSVAVQYEGATAWRPVTPEILAAPGGAVVNVVLPNDPPSITGFTASLDGKDVSQAPPGSIVTVKVDATSSANFPLHYKWADGAGIPVPGDQASVQWSLPTTKAMNTLYVEVSDGHGGVARASLPISTGAGSTAAQPAPAAPRFNLITPANGGHGPGNPHFQHSGPFIDPAYFMPCGDLTCAEEARDYYLSLGVLGVGPKGTVFPKGQYANFKTWKHAWGFSDDPTNPGSNETRAVYYNNGDLEFGRDMHCLAPTGLANPMATFVGAIINVCYVANYSPTGAPGGDPQTSVVEAEKSTGPIAVVAMVNVTTQVFVPLFPGFGFPGTWENNPKVNFFVFTASQGALVDDFVPSEFAVLDTEGPKAVPGVCMACHGGGNTSTVSTTGARFLPFDTPSFLYDTVNQSFSAASQSDNFRTLNTITYNADVDGGAALTCCLNITSQTILDLITGWYLWCGGVGTPGCAIDDVNHPYIPPGNCTSASEPATCGWSGDSVSAFVYQQVPRVVCRTCHIAHSDAFNWQNFQAVQASAAQAYSSTDTTSVCYWLNQYYMPLAQVPFDRLWTTSANSNDPALLQQLFLTMFPVVGPLGPLGLTGGPPAECTAFNPPARQ